MRTRKNVLIITVARAIGGVEKTYFNAMPLLKGKGYDFVFCVLKGGPAVAAYRRLGFKCLLVENRGREAIKRIESIIKEHKINLVHSNRLSIEAAVAADNCGISHLLHIHGEIQRFFPAWKPGRIKRRLAAVCDLSDFAIGCSRFVTNQLNGFIHPSKSACMYGAVPVRKIVCSKRTISGRIKTVGMIANFYPFKRHEDFILAAKNVLHNGVDANFFIAGHCRINDKPQKRYLRRLRKLVEDLGLYDRFKIYEGLGDVRHLYRKMDIFVLPSIGEGFSVALLEAMQFAKPVIVASRGGSPEVVRHRENGFLVGANKPKEIARTIIRLLEDEGLAAKVGEKARETVKRHFGMHRFVNEMAAVYDALI